jgi:hypothetical protein
MDLLGSNPASVVLRPAIATIILPRLQTLTTKLESPGMDHTFPGYRKRLSMRGRTL